MEDAISREGRGHRCASLIAHRCRARGRAALPHDAGRDTHTDAGSAARCVAHRRRERWEGTRLLRIGADARRCDVLSL